MRIPRGTRYQEHIEAYLTHLNQVGADADQWSVTYGNVEFAKAAVGEASRRTIVRPRQDQPDHAGPDGQRLAQYNDRNTGTDAKNVEDDRYGPGLRNGQETVNQDSFATREIRTVLVRDGNIRSVVVDIAGSVLRNLNSEETEDSQQQPADMDVSMRSRKTGAKENRSHRSQRNLRICKPPKPGKKIGVQRSLTTQV